MHLHKNRHPGEDGGNSSKAAEGRSRTLRDPEEALDPTRGSLGTPPAGPAAPPAPGNSGAPATSETGLAEDPALGRPGPAGTSPFGPLPDAAAALLGAAAGAAAELASAATPPAPVGTGSPGAAPAVALGAVAGGEIGRTGPLERTAPASRPEAPQPDPGAERARAESVLGQIRIHLARGRQQATLQLEPAELGRLSIRIHIEEGRLTASFRAESERTLALLERHVPELRAALAREGIAAEHFDLGLAGGGDGAPRGRTDRHRDGGFGRPSTSAMAARRGGDTGVPVPSDLEGPHGLHELSGISGRLRVPGLGVDTWA